MGTELQGRTAVVTGASKGIGLAVAEALAGAGATVIAGSRTTTPGLDALVKQGGVSWVPVDLAEPGAAERLVAAADGRLDILVNNVGAAPAAWCIVGDRRGLAAHGRSEPPHGRTGHPRRPAPDAVRRAGLGRDGRLGQRHPARPDGDRLQRGQGRAGRLLQGVF